MLTTNHARHVAMVRLTPAPFATIKLRQTPPVMVLTHTQLLLVLDRARGMHWVVVVTTDGAFYAAMKTTDLVHRAVAAGLVNGAFDRLASQTATARSVTLEVAAVCAFPLLDLPPPVRATWTVWHPHSLVLDDFWPGDVAHRLDRLFRLPAMGALVDACRNSTGPPHERLFATFAEVTRCTAAGPFLPLLCAALSSARVRARWASGEQNRVGTAAFWATLGRQYLARCVEVFWPTDATAACAITQLPGVRAYTLPAPRLEMLARTPADLADTPHPLAQSIVRFENSLDGPSLPPPSVEWPPGEFAPHPMDPNAPLPIVLAMSNEWRRVPDMRSLSVANVYCTGRPSQALIRGGAEFIMCPEHRLAEFIATSAIASIEVPLEKRRVCRAMGFFTENEPLPPGAHVVSVCARSSCDGTFVPGVNYVLALTHPTRLYASPAALAACEPGLHPVRMWPVSCVADLPFLLRSTAHSAATAVVAMSTTCESSARRYRCSEPGPSVCLEPPLQQRDVCAVLAFQAAHERLDSAAPTAVFSVHPMTDACAVFPRPMRWNPVRCRLDCTRCALQDPVATNGDSALVCRQELHLVLWWRWRRFAEFILLDHARAEELGTRWLRREVGWLVHAMDDVLKVLRASAGTPTPPTSLRNSVERSSSSVSQISSTMPRAPSGLKVSLGGGGGGYYGGVVHVLSDNSQWEIPLPVERSTLAAEHDMDALTTHIVYLLWAMGTDSAATYDGWIRVGRSLYTVDPASTTLEFVWQWWSRKYGGKSYNEQQDFVRRRKWPLLGPPKHDSIAAAMRDLIVFGRPPLPTTETVERALTEFWTEGQQWWAS